MKEASIERATSHIPRTIKALLESRNVDLKLRNKRGLNSLHLALIAKNQRFSHFQIKSSFLPVFLFLVSLVQCLLETEDDCLILPVPIGNKSLSLLHLACYKGSLEV